MRQKLPSIKMQTCMRRGGDVSIEIIGPHNNEHPVAIHRMMLQDAIKFNQQLSELIDDIIAALSQYRSERARPHDKA